MSEELDQMVSEGIYVQENWGIEDMGTEVADGNYEYLSASELSGISDEILIPGEAQGRWRKCP